MVNLLKKEYVDYLHDGLLKHGSHERVVGSAEACWILFVIRLAVILDTLTHCCILRKNVAGIDYNDNYTMKKMASIIRWDFYRRFI